MSQVIAGIYEIENKIGAGGGGVVYLGRHLRLEKPVVLKADKRTLSTGMETLRREVDMLKGLSHTYIPQVYDFVQEDGVVYTVMDFIEGESLDKLIGRNQRPPQAQVIKWACQLLDALGYLHSRPPYGILHGDIKPANIMLRPNGDVCLIDYNIALALGEDGAVKVGFSRGYASPEHYGKDYISDNRLAAVGKVSDVKYSGRMVDETRSLMMDDTQAGSVKPGCYSETRTLTMDDDDLNKTLTLNDREEQSRNPLPEYSGDRAENRAESRGINRAESRVGNSTGNSSGNSTGRRQGILLDARSDIYSLGATLYHLLSGRRPAEDALEVIPLGADICSPGVSAIIQKAMSPDPNMRYQSAEEMRTAFLQLYKNDIRVIRYKRRIAISAAMLALVFLIGGACTFIGLKQLEQLQKALALAEYSANSLAQGDIAEAVNQAMQAIPSGKSILEAPVTPQAQMALTDALRVYDLSEGFKSLNLLRLPSAPFDIAVSPNGTMAGVVYAYEVSVYEIETQKKVVSLPVQNSALADVVFIDETHIIYAGDKGITAYDLSTGEIMWMGEIATTLSVSADHAKVAAVNRDEDHAVIYSVASGKKVAECSFDNLHMPVAANDIFADPKDYIFTLNNDGSMLAVSFNNGGLVIFDLYSKDDEIIVYETSDYQHFEGGFCGKYFAFEAGKSNNFLFGLIDVEKGAYVGGYESQDAMSLQASEQGIYLASGSLLVSVNPKTLEEKELAYTNGAYINAFSVGEEHTLVAMDNNTFSFYDRGANLLSTESCSENSDFVLLTEMYAVIGNRTETDIRLLKLENHSEAQLMAYDVDYKHDEARISEDGKNVMLFSCQGFCIYDIDGSFRTQVKLPDDGSIYDQQFIKSDEGSWLEVTWYDGTIRCYSSADGSMISEKMGDKPSKDLFEEFYTDKYRIESGLHTAPEVYDLKSGKFVTKLEEDAYLTYVTQVGEYVITEYMSTDGGRYAYLLDSEMRKLAYLPRLCDIAGDMLVFDYESGNLRQCRLYSLQELVALGEAY